MPYTIDDLITCINLVEKKFPTMYSKLDTHLFPKDKNINMLDCYFTPTEGLMDIIFKNDSRCIAMFQEPQEILKEFFKMNKAMTDNDAELIIPHLCASDANTKWDLIIRTDYTTNKQTLTIKGIKNNETIYSNNTQL